MLSSLTLVPVRDIYFPMRLMCFTEYMKNWVTNPTGFELIITKNLWGADIDQRASQLASFVLLMKGRERCRRFSGKQSRAVIVPNIYYYQDFETDSKFDNAEALGSLIQVKPDGMKVFKLMRIPYSRKNNLNKALYRLLGQRYDTSVTNPPIGTSRMEASVKKYVEKELP